MISQGRAGQVKTPARETRQGSMLPNGKGRSKSAQTSKQRQADRPNSETVLTIDKFLRTPGKG